MIEKLYTLKELQEAVEQAKQEEREACVKTIEGFMLSWDKAQTKFHHIKYCAGKDILEAIQERGKE